MKIGNPIYYIDKCGFFIPSEKLQLISWDVLLRNESKGLFTSPYNSTNRYQNRHTKNKQTQDNVSLFAIWWFVEMKNSITWEFLK